MIDKDLLNLFRFLNHGATIEVPNHEMSEDLYDAMAFAQANDVTQFYGTPEFSLALEELVIELVGQGTWYL